MMKVQIKNCFLEENHIHTAPFLETYEWPDGTKSELPACCANTDLRTSEFPESSKLLITIETTNVETEMVSGIFRTELIQIDENLFLITEGDIDEPQTDAYFYQGNIDEVFEEYLKLEQHSSIHVRQILKAINIVHLDGVKLSQNWIPCTVFNESDELTGVYLSIKVEHLFNKYPDLLSETRQYVGLLSLWTRNIEKYMKGIL